MAAQVEVQSGDVGRAVAGARLHLNPLTDTSNKSLIEIPSINQAHIISQEPNKPVPSPKPRLTPKPFTVEKNPTIKPILAPKPQTKSRPESTRLAGYKPDPPSTPKPTPRPVSTNPNRPATTSFKTSNKLGTGQTAKPVVQPFKPAPPLPGDICTPTLPVSAEREKPAASSLAYSKSLKGPSAAEWSGSTRKDDERGQKAQNEGGSSITRAKSMGFLVQVGQEEDVKDKGQPEAPVPLRPQPRSSRPRPVSAIFPVSPTKAEAPVPVPRWVGRRPLSADLTSKFESIGLSLHRKSPKENTTENTPEEKLLPQRKEQEINPMSATPQRTEGTADSAIADQSDKKKEETALRETEEEKCGTSIKSRISLLLDSSASPGPGVIGTVLDLHSPVQPVPETEPQVGVKQLIKQLTEDVSPIQSPVMKPVLKPRPLPLDLTKRFSSERSPDLVYLTEAADRHDISKDPQTGVEESLVSPNDQKMFLDLKDSSEALKKPSTPDRPEATVKESGSTGEAHTVRASMFENVIERHSVFMLDEGRAINTAKDPLSSLLFDTGAVENEGSLVTAIYKEPVSPSSPLRVLHAFDTVHAVEGNKAVSESVASAQWEDKAMTLRSRRSEGTRSVKTDPVPAQPASLMPEPPLRYLRIGALQKWSTTGLDQDASSEKGMLKKPQSEVQMTLDKDVHMQRTADQDEAAATPKRLKMLQTEEQPKPKATYFALTGQMQEPVFPGDVAPNFGDMTVPFDNFSVRSALGCSQGKVLTVKRNPSLEEAFGKNPSSQEQFDALTRSHMSPMNEQTKEEMIDAEKKREQKKEMDRERAKINEFKREKRMEMEKQAHLEFTWMKEMEMQREAERKRQKLFDKDKQELGERQCSLEIQKQIELEKQKLQEFEKKQREQGREKRSALEKQKLQESEIEKKREIERERQLEKLREKERERAQAMERQRQRDEERQRELDKERLQLENQKEKQKMEEIERAKELERQMLVEYEKQKQKEREKQQLIELERSRLREKTEREEAEKLQQMALEQEMLRIKELEKERAKQREMERQIEKEKQMELEKQSQRELEREKQRKLDLERQELENQRARQRELEKEKQRKEELEMMREMERRQLLEFERQRLAEREKLLELEKCKVKEKMEREEAEKMRLIAKQQEAERQRLKEKQRKEELERLRLESSALKPKVLDLDSVLRDDLSPKSISQRSDPATRWKEPYKPAILDIDSFTSQAQLSPSKDFFPVSSFQGPHTESGVRLQPTPERDLNWKVPPQNSGGFSNPVWTTSPQDPWELRPVEISADKPMAESRKHANKLSPDQLPVRQEEWLPNPQRHWPAFLDEPLFLAPIPVAEVKTGNSPYGITSSTPEEPIWIPREPQPPKASRVEIQSQRRSQGSQELNRMRSRSVSRRSAPSSSAVEGNLSRMRSRSAHREQDCHPMLQQKQSSEEDGKDSETPVHEPDSQYGTWDTGLHTDDSLTPATPSSESNLTPSPRKPTPPHTLTDHTPQLITDTLDGLLSSSSADSQQLPFPDAPTTLLDTSALRSRAQLGKKRAPRTRPSRAARQKDEEEGGNADDWLYRDSTEAKTEKDHDSESEEHARGADSGPPVSLQPQRVALFPGVDPSALKTQLKKRGDSDNQTDAPVPSPSQLSRSPKSPFLPRAARVLPPPGGKDNGEEGSPQWLKELKSKKRLSQYENES